MFKFIIFTETIGPAPTLAATSWWFDPSPSTERWAEMARKISWGIRPSGRPQ